MKFAFLIGGELRGVKKTVNNLYKYIIDYYNADVFILCQKHFEDDEERLSLFDRNVVYSKLYDKPNPCEYFNKEFQEINRINMVTWAKYENLQIYINMNEYAKLLENYKDEYDYFIHFRPDIEILFPFPEKDFLENIPKGVYMFEFYYSLVWGGQGLGNFIHNDFVVDYFKSSYDFIKKNDISTILFTHRINIYNYIPNYKKNYNIDNVIMDRGLTQEFILLLGLQEKNITVNTVLNPNFFYTAESLDGRTTKESIKFSTTNNIFYKYEDQLVYAYNNLNLWENGYRWFYDNNNILLKTNKCSNICINILIPNYNKGAFIEETLVSIFKQNTNYNYNIIICDDCSTDNSVEIINKYLHIYPSKIKLFENEKNIGALQTSMKLYEKVGGDYFTVLDSDDYWIDNYFIENAITFLETNNTYTIYANNTKKLIDSTLTNCIYNFSGKMKIDFYNLTTMPHTSSTIFRNVLFSEKKDTLHKLSLKFGSNCEKYYEGEPIRVLLHLEKGFCYLDSEKIAGVYRISSNGLWNGLCKYRKCLTNLKGIIDVSKFFEYKYKRILLKSEVMSYCVQTTLSMNEDSDNYDESICLYKVLIDYLETYNNKAIDEENFLFYDVENYEYKYNYIFIRILKLFKYLNKKIYKLGSVDEGNNYSKILPYDKESNEKINLILPYNYDYNSDKIDKDNVTIFYIGDFK